MISSSRLPYHWWTACAEQPIRADIPERQRGHSSVGNQFPWRCR
jgi:hypothetical protein